MWLCPTLTNFTGENPIALLAFLANFKDKLTAVVHV